MTEYNFELKVEVVRNIPFFLDAILELGVGVIMVIRSDADTILLTVGWTFIVLGGVQFATKVKTFHLTNTELIIKRPLVPFHFGEHRFQISKIKEIKFINVPGRFGGPHLNIVTADIAESYRIETTKEKIDEFEIQLQSLGLAPIRDGM
jgi:hypothetical protein